MKLNRRSFGVKLWLYFILFSAVILVMLWLMQIVFLQSFYEGMKTRDIERVARTLAEAYSQTDFESVADRAAYSNSILVYVTDDLGNILYTTDEHGYNGPKRGDPPPDNARGGTVFRPLPEDYADFLSRLKQSDDGWISYTVSQKKLPGTSLVCGVLLKDAVLYISTPLDPVEATTSILQTQLAYVTAAALLLSFVIAYFLSRKFSRPVAATTAQAKELATGAFPTQFEKGFCLELDALADALSYVGTELSKVEKFRKELIANISHDLRTPLTMIKAYTEMIRDISGDNKEKREAHLGVIAGETERLIRLVDDLLALSAIESGNAPVSMDNLNVSEAVRKVLIRFEPIFAREGYSLGIDIEPDQYAFADPQKIDQVLYNLVGNAMHYVGEGKSVDVHVRNLGAWVRVEVTDHGEGIAQEERALIWERYYRAKTHPRDKVGTGLGLSIVKGILELHGARFGVDSRIGEGSTFWFELKK